jgi:hypothetical protein
MSGIMQMLLGSVVSAAPNYVVATFTPSGTWTAPELASPRLSTLWSRVAVVVDWIVALVVEPVGSAPAQVLA